MEGARALTRDGVPSIVSRSLELQSLGYSRKQNQYQHHLAEVEYGFDSQGVHPLSRRLNASLKTLALSPPLLILYYLDNLLLKRCIIPYSNRVGV